MAEPMTFVVGVDVGGTFTDVVAVDTNGGVYGAKTPSTPPDYSVGVLAAVADLAADLGFSLTDLLTRTAYIAHGTTSAINALVTGEVPEVGFITTKGHRDSIYVMNVEGRYLGRPVNTIQDVQRTAKPTPLVPRDLAFEVTERVDQSGAVVVPVDDAEVRSAVRALRERGVEAIAVSLLWSFRNPVHEHRVRAIIDEEAPGTFVALSSDVSPRIREFARSATTILSTQLAPPLRRYLEPLADKLRDEGLNGPVLVMQASGGTVLADKATARAVTTVGSTLSGGVVGACALAHQLGHRDVITADMGGTTFLVGMVVGGEPKRSAHTVINQHPVNVPAIQVSAIGSGGGTIAWVDHGRNLRVGPLSAAAVPGPAAYGAGGFRPTVTDANLVLGIIDPDYFLGGRYRLHRELAEAALAEHVGAPLGLSVEAAAAAVFEIQNCQTADLARKVVVESGHDPRDFVVYAFGGSGPIHAAAVAEELGARELVVPLGAVASGFSAYGLAVADLVVEVEHSDPQPFPLDPRHVRARYAMLEDRARSALLSQGVRAGSMALRREFDARYTAQMFEVTSPAPGGPVDAAMVEAMTANFERRYAELFGEGSGFAAAGYQIVTYRVRGSGRLADSPGLPRRPVVPGDPSVAVKGHRRVQLDHRRGFERTPIYDYAALGRGSAVEGPAVIEVPTTTVVVPPGRRATVDHLGNIRMVLD